jgi:hypothetical protein
MDQPLGNGLEQPMRWGKVALTAEAGVHLWGALYTPMLLRHAVHLQELPLQHQPIMTHDHFDSLLRLAQWEHMTLEPALKTLKL